MCAALTGCTLYSNGEDLVTESYDIKEPESEIVASYDSVDKNGPEIEKYQKSNSNYDDQDSSADANYDASYDKVPVICLDYGACKEECTDPKYLPITPNTKVSSYRITDSGSFDTADTIKSADKSYPAVLKDGLTWANNKSQIKSFLSYLETDKSLAEIKSGDKTPLEIFKGNHMYSWYTDKVIGSDNVYVPSQEKGGKSGSTYECDVLYPFVTELGKQLEEKGYSVIYTRDSGNKSSAISVDERAKQINNSGATMCISFSMCRSGIKSNIDTKIAAVAPEYSENNENIIRSQIYAQMLNWAICNQDSSATGTDSNKYSYTTLTGNTKKFASADVYASYAKVGDCTLVVPATNTKFVNKNGVTKDNMYIRVTTTKADPILYYVTQVPTFEIMLGDIRSSDMVKAVKGKSQTLINGCIEGIEYCAPLPSEETNATEGTSSEDNTEDNT